MVYVNDKPLAAPNGATLKELISLAGLDPARLVVSVDGKAVARSELKRTVPADGARIKTFELQDGG